MAQTRHVDVRNPQAATFIVAASDSLHKERADYVCNGTDDQVEIQTAIDALPVGGGKVILLEGTYNISSDLTLDSKLEGMGLRSSILNLGTNHISLQNNAILTNLKVEADSAGMAMNDAVVIYNGKAEIVNVEIDGTSTGADPNSGSHAITFASGSDGSIVRNCEIHHLNQSGIDTWHATDGANVSRIMILGNEIHHCIYEDGIALLINDSLIRGNIVHDCYEASIVIGTSGASTCKNVSIESNVCYDCAEGPRVSWGGANAPENCSISNNTIYDCCSAGHVPDATIWLIGKNLVCEGNTIDGGNYGYGIYVEGEDITISGNIVYNVATAAIYGDYDRGTCTIRRLSIVGNSLYGSGSAVYMDDQADGSHAAQEVIIDGNICYGGNGHNAVSLDGGGGCIVTNNWIYCTTPNYTAVSLFGAQNCIVSNNKIEGTCRYGVRLFRGNSSNQAIDNVVTDNIIEGPTIGIGEMDSADYNIIKNNNLRHCATPISTVGLHTIVWEHHSDIFMDVLAVSATHVVNAQACHVDPTTLTVGAGIAAQPDVPRTFSWVVNNAGGITAADITITGIDAKGNSISESFDLTGGLTGETNNAFATVSQVKIENQVNAAAGDTISVGITDVLGLSNIIYATGDVYKIKKNNADAVLAAAQVDTDYDTYDMSVIGLAATNDFTIWFKSNLNIIT